MMRRLAPGRLVVASHNEGKVREIAELLGPFGIEPVSAAALDLPEPEETGVAFADNADLKARLAADLSGLPALADDSGLCVDALDGRPGVLSARWAGENRDFGLAMERVQQELLAKEPEASRAAHFVCALAVAWPKDGQCENFVGRVDGALVWPPRGNKGFGYDPMFQPTGHNITFGEMDPEQKHAISHRADAFRKLVTALL
jgi:XTP/dITP diphosphohydrolase